MGKQQPHPNPRIPGRPIGDSRELPGNCGTPQPSRKK